METRRAREARERALGAEESLQRMLQHVEQYSRRASGESGITGAQAWALQILSRSSGLSIGALAGRMYLHISSASSLVDALEGRALVRRIRDLQDRRLVHLRPTPEGERVARRLGPAPRSLIRGFLERLPRADLRAFERVLTRLTGAMGVAERPAGGRVPGGPRGAGPGRP